MKVRVLSVLILAMSFTFVEAVCSAEKKESAVEGRVVGRDGKPLSGIKVVAVLARGEHREGYDWFEVKTKSDGMFVLKGLYPGTYYKIIFKGGQCNDPTERIRSHPRGETLKLKKDYLLLFSPFKVLSDGVIKDLRTGLEWAPVSPMRVNYEVAFVYAKSLGHEGGGWRLPTVYELEDLYETAKRACGLDGAFVNRYPKVWASDVKSPLKRWIVKFYHDRVCAEPWNEQSYPCDDCRVLPVRFPEQ